MSGHPTSHQLYWRANLIVLAIHLFIWFLFSCVFSVFLVDRLNAYHIGGFPLGFWIAQQGTTIAFILLIASYVVVMKKLDRKYGVEEEDGQ